MTEPSTLPRPRQVTVAGAMAATGCLLLVFSLFDAMAQMRSADMRDEVASLLSKPPGSGLGLEVDTVLDLLRGLVLFSGGLAAAGTVLSVYVFRRHQGARIGLSVVAGLMLVSATFVAGPLPIVVAIAATMLWGREARDWFAGRRPQAADRPSPWQAPPAGSTGTPSPPTTTTTSAPPSSGPFSAEQPPASARPFAGAPYAGPPMPYPGPPPSGRPGVVTAAVWLTWVFSALAALGFGLVALTLVVRQTELLEALQRDSRVAEQNLSGQQIIGFLWVLSAVAIFWSLGAIALATLAFRRVNAGRIGLLVSASFAGMLGLLAFPVGLVHAAAAFTTVALLLRGAAGRWYAGDGPPSAGGPWPGQDPFAVPPPPEQPRDKPPVW